MKGCSTDALNSSVKLVICQILKFLAKSSQGISLLLKRQVSGLFVCFFNMGGRSM